MKTLRLLLGITQQENVRLKTLYALTIRSLKERYHGNLDSDTLGCTKDAVSLTSHEEFEMFVRDFAIDDSISDCFAESDSDLPTVIGVNCKPSTCSRTSKVHTSSQQTTLKRKPQISDDSDQVSTSSSKRHSKMASLFHRKSKKSEKSAKTELQTPPDTDKPMQREVTASELHLERGCIPEIIVSEEHLANSLVSEKQSVLNKPITSCKEQTKMDVTKSTNQNNIFLPSTSQNSRIESPSCLKSDEFYGDRRTEEVNTVPYCDSECQNAGVMSSKENCTEGQGSKVKGPVRAREVISSSLSSQKSSSIEVISKTEQDNSSVDDTKASRKKSRFRFNWMTSNSSVKGSKSAKASKKSKSKINSDDSSEEKVLPKKEQNDISTSQTEGDRSQSIVADIHTEQYQGDNSTTIQITDATFDEVFLRHTKGKLQTKVQSAPEPGLVCSYTKGNNPSGKDGTSLVGQKKDSCSCSDRQLNMVQIQRFGDISLVNSDGLMLNNEVVNEDGCSPCHWYNTEPDPLVHCNSARFCQQDCQLGNHTPICHLIEHSVKDKQSSGAYNHQSCMPHSHDSLAKTSKPFSSSDKSSQEISPPSTVRNGKQCKQCQLNNPQRSSYLISESPSKFYTQRKAFYHQDETQKESFSNLQRVCGRGLSKSEDVLADRVDFKPCVPSSPNDRALQNSGRRPSEVKKRPCELKPTNAVEVTAGQNRIISGRELGESATTTTTTCITSSSSCKDFMNKHYGSGNDKNGSNSNVLTHDSVSNAVLPVIHNARVNNSNNLCSSQNNSMSEGNSIDLPNRECSRDDKNNSSKTSGSSNNDSDNNYSDRNKGEIDRGSQPVDQETPMSMVIKELLQRLLQAEEQRRRSVKFTSELTAMWLHNTPVDFLTKAIEQLKLLCNSHDLVSDGMRSGTRTVKDLQNVIAILQDLKSALGDIESYMCSLPSDLMAGSGKLVENQNELCGQTVLRSFFEKIGSCTSPSSISVCVQDIIASYLDPSSSFYTDPTVELRQSLPPSCTVLTSRIDLANSQQRTERANIRSLNNGFHNPCYQNFKVPHVGNDKSFCSQEELCEHRDPKNLSLEKGKSFCGQHQQNQQQQQQHHCGHHEAVNLSQDKNKSLDCVYCRKEKSEVWQSSQRRIPDNLGDLPRLVNFQESYQQEFSDSSEFLHTGTESSISDWITDSGDDEFDEDEDEEEEDDEYDERILRGVDVEDCDVAHEDLWLNRLHQHLQSVQKLREPNNNVIETVVTDKGEILSPCHQISHSTCNSGTVICRSGTNHSSSYNQPQRQDEKYSFPQGHHDSDNARPNISGNFQSGAAKKSGLERAKKFFHFGGIFSREKNMEKETVGSERS